MALRNASTACLTAASSPAWAAARGVRPMLATLTAPAPPSARLRRLNVMFFLPRQSRVCYPAEQADAGTAGQRVQETGLVSSGQQASAQAMLLDHEVRRTGVFASPRAFEVDHAGERQFHGPSGTERPMREG